MSGLNEILIIALLVVGVLILPRMVKRAPTANPMKLIKGRRPLSGPWRLAIFVSVLWPVLTAAFLKPWVAKPEVFLYYGIGPVVLGWALYWVLRGYR